MESIKVKTKHNIYVKGYKKFPYQKLTGKHYLYYTGDIIFYDESLPDEYDYKNDFVFDCECEFEGWSKIIKVRQTK
jgi:hypothetical protein